MKFITTFLCATALMTTFALAGSDTGWTSVDEASIVAFGSIKSDDTGEVHQFQSVSGTVSDAGEISISIDVTSVETYIDIRNERMMEHVFQDGEAEAVLTGQVDLDAVTGIEVGDTKVVEMEGTLTFGGIESYVDANLLVARLAEDRVLVTTADLIMLSTADLGIDPGIDKLMELASLPSITRVAPVTVRMVFEK
ncbi:YceI family protein [Roseobacter weihaiensis]|uniref:YceI family protein n=1 Tax=Roseobacter weihaiensis TaxID=2763262 RepID=UPI001D0A059D|nr:YceI family protein [Roseobacter sp. H9]